MKTLASTHSTKFKSEDNLDYGEIIDVMGVEMVVTAVGKKHGKFTIYSVREFRTV